MEVAHMKIVIALLALIMTISISATAQSKTSERDAKVTQELRSLVRAWDEAYVKGDTATLDRLLADEFAFVGGQKKTEYLASFKSRNLAIDSAVSTEIEVQVYGDMAVLTGVDTITAKNKDQTLVTKWLYMDVWIKRSGRWQCVKTYSSPLQKSN
jgi:ketosteroid isomerase-like protein